MAFAGLEILEWASIGWSIYSTVTREEEETSPTYSPDPLQNTKKQTLPIPVVYGHNRVAGNIIYQDVHYETQDEETVSSVDYQVALSEGPVNDVINVNAEEVPLKRVMTQQIRAEARYFGEDRKSFEITEDMVAESNIILKWEIEDKYAADAWINSPTTNKWRDCVGCGDSITITPDDDQYIGEWELVSLAIFFGKWVQVEIWKEVEPDGDVRLGNSVQTDHPINNIGQTFPYLAYVSINIDETDFQLINSPTVTSEVQGRLVEVWNGSEWVEKYSDNPAYILLDLITNNRYGMGLDKNNIELESFKSAADYCDELIPIGGPNVNDVEEKRFQLDTVIDKQASAKEQIDNILKTFRAHLVPREGKLALKIDGPDEKVQDFTEDNIVKESFGYNKLSKKEKPNKVIVEYIDPNENWSRNTVESTHQGDIKKTGQVREKKLSLFGIKRRTQAKREADFFKRQIWYCDTFASWQAGVDSIHCEIGDVVTVTHSLPGWVEKKFRIIDISEAEDEIMDITAQEYNESIYSDTDVEFDYPQRPELPNPNDPPPSVENLSLIEGNKVLGDGTWIPRIEISWDKPQNLFWERAIIYLSDDNGANWEEVKKVEGTKTRVEVDPATYKVRVQSENRLGIKENFGEANTGSITINGKDAPPSDVIFGACDFDEIIILRWQAVNDDDLKAYEVRTDKNWGDDDAGLVYKGNTLKTDYKPTQRQYTFFIKALDRSGNYSANYDEITLINSSPSAPNFSSDDITEFFEAIKIHTPTVSDATGYKVYITPSDGVGNATGDAEIIPTNTAQTITYNLDSVDSVLIKIGTYDNLTSIMNDENISAEIEASATQIGDIAQFAQDLRPPKVVDSKPNLPNEDYPVGSSIILSTSGKLYINENGEWVSKTDKADLAVDALTAGTVEAGAIGADEIATDALLARHFQAMELEAAIAKIKNAFIDDADILNVRANKIISDELLANLIVSRGSITIKGNEKEEVDSITMMGMGARKDGEITNEWNAWEMSADEGMQGYDSDGNRGVLLTKNGQILLRSFQEDIKADDSPAPNAEPNDFENYPGSGGTINWDQSGLKTIAPNGDYSILSGGNINFYKADHPNTPYKYISRVVRGSCPDGAYISLKNGTMTVDGNTYDITNDPNFDGVDGVPWDSAPKVLTSIKSLRSFSSQYSDKDQEYYCEATNVTKDGFKIRGYSRVPSSQYSQSGSWSGDEGDTVVSDYTNSDSATKIEIGIELYADYDDINVDERLVYDLDLYYEENGSWKHYDNYSGSTSWHISTIDDYIGPISISGLTADSYRFKLVINELTHQGYYNGSTHEITDEYKHAALKNFKYTAEEILENGEVTFIAIE